MTRPISLDPSGQEPVEQKEEFFYNYRGFTGKVGTCFIRVLNSPGRPLVVICSQMKDNKTTSITNAVDYISYDIFTALRNRKRSLIETIMDWLYVEPWSKRIGDTRNFLRDKEKLVIRVLGVLEQAAKISEAYSENRYRIDSAIWIEHYSRVLGYFEEDRYAIISFKGEHRTPEWYHMNLDDIAKVTFYPIQEIRIDENLVLTSSST